ncbi:putative mitochondrial phosphate carrier protein 3, mitochondrial-like isoform X1 [Capsicum annuum]|nr:putative mitochondrial phosphate carrier protein 3, mitochondrial-like isoform X1 [Capsicum annuum]KAF3677875.1 putative mitochondrial phosphate carrier protein 3, mitochondrial-like isoform X1 [Capsicum annuum]
MQTTVIFTERYLLAVPQQWKPLKISKVAKVGEFLLLLKFPSLRKKKKVNILVGITEPAEWKRFNSKELGISSSMIAKPAKIVLNGLRSKGFEVYLVGGCVRDLILKRAPKDFDIITTAELKEVRRTFSRCEIVGRRFPICHVHVDDEVVECPHWPTAFIDFVLLMFDPYSKLIYDYMGGVDDIRKAKVQTIGPASFSFIEDCARILRAIRIAARLGFRFGRETALSIKNLSSSVLRLDRGRLLMEMNYMLAYGSAEASLRLLWKFGLLEILLPIQAAYFVRHGFRRRDKRSNLLLSLFSNLDKLVAPDRPCHSSLWVTILAFHNALSDQPRDPLVVAAFSLGVHNGGDLSEALSIAKRISAQHNGSFHELESRDLSLAALKEEVVELATSVQRALTTMTDEYFVSRAMSNYPKAPYSDLVFIPLALYLKACNVCQCVRMGKEKGFVAKKGNKIDYELLASGSLQEVRHVFARVVFDTIYPLNIGEDDT